MRFGVRGAQILAQRERTSNETVHVSDCERSRML
jgi:hypothetical protein